MSSRLFRILVAIALFVTLWGAGANDAATLPLDPASNIAVLDAQEDCDADPDASLFHADNLAVAGADLRNIYPRASNTLRLTDPGLPPPPPPPESA